MAAKLSGVFDTLSVPFRPFPSPFDESGKATKSPIKHGENAGFTVVLGKNRVGRISQLHTSA